MAASYNILLYAFFVFTGIQLLYYLIVFTRNLGKSVSTHKISEGVSVIICARNERKNLEEHLHKFLEQDFPEFEVIVVNDGSTDGTTALLEELEKENKKLKLVQLDIDEKYYRGKKFALTIGIKAAKYEIVLLSDADCHPIGKDWISKMTSGFGNPQTEIILGLGHYDKRNRPLNWMIQLDTFHTAFMYTNFSKMGNSYMGVGRNLAYRKPLFFKFKGYASHQHIMGGDDDLFVNEASTKTNTEVCLDPGSYTISQAHTSFRKWSKQKLRHISTSSAYKTNDKLALGMYSLSLIALYIILAILLSAQFQWVIVLSVFGFRFLVQSVILPVNMYKLGFKNYIPLYILFDPFWILMYLYLGVRSVFYSSKPKSWS